MKIIISDFLAVYLFILLISIPTSWSQMKSAAYARTSDCKIEEITDDEFVKPHEDIMPTLAYDKGHGYLGTIGIIGGSSSNMGATYFAAMSALRVGADEVHVFCFKNVAAQLQAMNPDIIVHALVDIDVNLLLVQMGKMDVILFGPGALHDAHMLTNVLPRVIRECKKEKKPLVLDLEPFFITQNIINELANYPAPGVVIILNSREFELFYTLTKMPASSGDASIYIDFKNKLGDNCIIFRTGCTDSAVSSNPLSSWSYSGKRTPKRANGQGDMISGMTSVFFNWADKKIAKNLIQTNGPMFPAAVATYKASKTMRMAAELAWNEKGVSVVACEIIQELTKASL